MEHSKDFQKFKEYYDRGDWNYEMLYNAVLKGRITEKEFKEIVGENE